MAANWEKASEGAAVSKKKISVIEAKILKDLLEDGRKTFTDVAKECGVSASMIWKRYRELKKVGIIVGATIHLDYASLGYNAVGTIQFRVAPERADQIVENIQRIPNIHSVWRSGKSSEISVVPTLKTLDELDRVKEKIKRLPSASEVRTTIWTGIKNIPENLDLISLQKTAIKIDQANTQAIGSIRKKANKIDQTDRRIIEKLALNGRVPFRKIAEELKISTDTVVRRYKKLAQNGTIRVIIQIDLTKLGYRGAVFFKIAFVPQESMSPMVEILAKIPDVTLIIRTSGDYDLFVVAMVRDIEHLISIQNEILSISDVTKVEISVQRPRPIMPSRCEYISTF
jgi:DNA-binding Lrp family transcriptional regulator